jgi:hypothetical protein
MERGGDSRSHALVVAQKASPEGACSDCRAPRSRDAYRAQRSALGLTLGVGAVLPVRGRGLGGVGFVLGVGFLGLVLVVWVVGGFFLVFEGLVPFDGV